MSNEEKILEMLGNLTNKVDQIQTDQQQMKENIASIKADQAGMKADISDLRTTVTRVAVTQENVVIPQIKLLGEGHEALLNTLARKDRMEALEDDVALLKTVIKAMSQRITDLEKAQ